MFTASIIFASTSAFADEEKSAEVESRGMPQIQKPMQPGMPVQPGAPAQQKFQLPGWPQKFEIEDQQPASFGVVVTQPGPLVVDVQWQGPPLEVALRGSSPQPITQRGQGQVRLNYQVMPQDVQRGVLWIVHLALVSNAKGKASGQVTVQHPPVNEAQAEAAVRMRVEQAKSQRQLTPAQIQAHSQALLQARKNVIDRQHQGYIRETAVKADTFLKQKGFQGQIQSRGGGLPLGFKEELSPRKNISLPPHIDSLSVTQGPPGTVVVIQGGGFTNDLGHVHMIVNPTRELEPKVNLDRNSLPIWTDTYISVTVPELTGVAQFTANFFVSLGVDRYSFQLRSNSVPFTFIPRQQVRVVSKVTGDYRLAGIQSFGSGQGGGGSPSFVINNEIHHTRLDVLVPFWLTNIFIGTKGNDWFFENTLLKNGWKFDCVELLPYDPHCSNTVAGAGPGSGAYVVAGLGSASPKFAVRWWLDAFIPGMTYTYAFTISGPEETPDGIEVP